MIVERVPAVVVAGVGRSPEPAGRGGLALQTNDVGLEAKPQTR